MRVTTALRSGGRRVLLLGLIVGAGLVGALAAWATDDLGLGIAILGVTAFVALLAKMSLETWLDTQRAQASAERATTIASASADQADRLRAVESAVGGQQSFNDAVLNRVRAVESASGQQEGFNEAVLDRVRAVESASGRQEGFNEAVVRRVRVVESATRDLQSTHDRTLDRVRAVEAGLGIGTHFRESPPGIERRLGRVSDLISQAMQVVKDSHYFVATPTKPVGVDDVPESSSPSTSPVVTVVAPCYNEERFAAEALESIRAQSFEDWECVVVDDGSTDGSADVIRAAIVGDRRFHLIQQPTNRGLVAARNTGIEAASGQYVVFHDIDDLMMRDSLADRVATLRTANDPDVAGVYCGQRIADEGVRLNELPVSERWEPRSMFFDFVTAGGECPFGPSQAMLRTDVVRALGGFNEAFDTAEDWEFWLRIMRHGFVFRAASLLTVAYRQKWASMAQTGATNHVSKSIGLIDSAYSPAQLHDLDVSASYVFPEPLPYYQELLTRARRAVQYASTALVRGDVAAFDEILGQLDAGSWPLVRRHISLSGRITDGLRRAAGLDLGDLPEIVEDFAPLCAAIEASVEKATS